MALLQKKTCSDQAVYAATFERRGSAEAREYYDSSLIVQVSFCK
jgi:hypothetical protein